MNVPGVFSLVDDLIACVEENASTDAMRNMAVSARARADALRAEIANPKSAPPKEADSGVGDAPDGNEPAPPGSKDAGDVAGGPTD